MRKFFLINLLVLLLAACQSNRQGQQGSDSGDSLKNVGAVLPHSDGPAAIKFDKVYFDLDVLELNGPDQTRDYLFTNTGGAPLVIQKVETSCPCVDVDYPKDPIAPGTRSKITLTLKMEEISSGQFLRTADVYTNASEKPVEISMQGIKKYE